MNTNQMFLSAMVAAALFAAAPITAQKIVDPTVAETPVPVDPDPVIVPPVPTQDYVLQVEAVANLFSIHDGIPGFPVAMMIGVQEARVLLPGSAMLRLDPLAIVLLGNFDSGGFLRISLGSNAPPVPPVEGLLQALSVDRDGRSFFTSELIFVRTDLANLWEFEFRG